MGREKLGKGAKKVAGSNMTHALLTGLAMGAIYYGVAPDSYDGMERNPFNSTEPIDTQGLWGAHNGVSSTKEGTPFYSASQQLDLAGLLDVGIRSLEMDVHYHGSTYVTAPPTISPSAAPSEIPSAAPSAIPSAAPSSAPSESAAPSGNPSAAPSTTPTITARPTSSNAPSESPTESLAPSESPSKSSMPSFSPSASPTTAAPSDMPSREPSTAPSESMEPTTSNAPSASPTSSLSPTEPPTATMAPTNSMAPTNPVVPSREGYVAKHGEPDALAFKDPVNFEDSLNVFKDYLDSIDGTKDDRVIIFKLDDYALGSFPDARQGQNMVKEAKKMVEDVLGDYIHSDDEQRKYADANGGKWPSQDELLASGKKVIFQNQHEKAQSYDIDFFSNYGENEGRLFYDNALRGLEGFPIPDGIAPPPPVGKFNKAEAVEKGKQGGVTSYDHLAKGDYRKFEHKDLAPEMSASVFSNVMRFSPETKAGSAAMFGAATAYATAIGLVGASMLAKKGKKEDGKDGDDKSVGTDGAEMSYSGTETEKPKKSTLVAAIDKAEAFVNAVAKSALPLAAVGQASLRLGALVPDKRVLATGVAAVAFGIKASSEAYLNSGKDNKAKDNDSPADNISPFLEDDISEIAVKSDSGDDVEVGLKQRRGKRQKDVSVPEANKPEVKGESDKSDRIKLAAAVAASAVLNVTGSDKANSPFPIRAAAAVTATALAVDAIPDLINKMRPGRSTDKQPLSAAKLHAKAGVASLILAQNLGARGEGLATVGAVVEGARAAVNAFIYGGDKAIDYVAEKGKSWVDKVRKEDQERQSLVEQGGLPRRVKDSQGISRFEV